MRTSLGLSISVSVFVLLTLVASPAGAAEDWQPWADSSNGLASGVNPWIAISNEREIFYSFLAPQMDGDGRVWRASLDDPNRQFTLMPSFPLPTPPANTSYNNVGALGTNARGEPVVGVSTNGNWQVFEPMIFTWDEDAEQWIAADILPADEGCAHNIRGVALAPNGDLWATCQWSGAYHSTDDGRSFEYVDVTAAVMASEPSYIPTRANGALDLGALYGLTIGPDGNIYIGTESGGVVYSDDSGQTFRPLDQDPSNQMSTMARATNSGNIAGVGLTSDGKVIVQGGDGNGAYPPEETIGLWVFDLAAKTTTTAVGLPDYVFAGLTVGQFVTLPSGRIYMHSSQDTVDPMTGDPAFGGILSSDDAIHWDVDNGGIDDVFMIPNMNVWVDGNGRAKGHPFANDGDDIYVVTSTGKIFVRYGDPGSGDTDTDTDTGTDTSTGAETDTGTGAETDTGATGSGTDAGESSTDAGSSSGSAGQHAEAGCSCSTDSRSGSAAPLLLLAWVGLRRRRE